MTKEELDRAKLHETHRSNLAQEQIGREANLLKTLGMAGSAFKGVVGAAPAVLKGLIDNASNFDINEGFRRTHNDPSWYMQGTGAESYGQTSFNVKQGVNLELPLLKGTGNNTYYSLPNTFGVKFKFMPMLGGYSLDSAPNTSTTQAIYQLYDKLRTSNTGSVPYTMEDFTKYFVWYDAAATFYAYMVKVYGILNIRIPENRAIPFRLVNLTVGEVDSDSGDLLLQLTANKADFRNKLNAIADLLNSFVMPGIFDYVTRHIWLASNIFTDDESIDRAQFITIDPDMYGGYVDQVGEIPSGIVAHAIPFAESYDDILTELNLFSSEIIKRQMDSTWSIMSSDLQKMALEYGKSVIKMPYIAEDYTTPLLHDANLLQQLRNADICNLHAPEASYGGLLKAYAPYVEETATVLPFNWWYHKTNTQGKDISAYPILNVISGTGLSPTQPMILNCYQDNPSPADVYVATRFKVVPYKLVVPGASGSTSYTMIKACGSEVLISASIVTITKSNANTMPVSNRLELLHNCDSTDWVPLATRYAIHQIEWFPTLWCATSSGVYPFGVIENIASLDPNCLAELHGRAMRSMLGIYAYASTTYVNSNSRPRSNISKGNKNTGSKTKVQSGKSDSK